MTVVITGASRGIGQALFDRYAAAGRPVIGTTRDTAAGSGWVHLDVTDPASQRAFCTALEDQPIDLLVCNAGIYPDKGHSLADGFPPEMWAETFATNVTGVFLTIQNLLPNLQMHGGAKIAIIASRLGSDTLAGGGSYIYRASKAAALSLGRNLAVDLAHIGVAVGIYHPGWVRTDMGGSGAAIPVEDAADGLIRRFEALSPATTGCFETWDGERLPF